MCVRGNPSRSGSHGMFESIDPALQRQPARPRWNRMKDDSGASRKACLVNCWRSRSLSNSMIGSLRYFVRPRAILAALILLVALFCPTARSADDKDKEKKPEKEKKEKIE